MEMRGTTRLEKLPVYLVAWSVPLFFLILAASVLGLYRFADDILRVLRARFMFSVVLAGTVFSFVALVIRKLKGKPGISFLELSRTVLMPLAYFTFYFAAHRIIIAAVCVLGTIVGILLANRLTREN